MAHADDGGLRHLGMADGEVFDVDRGNPLAARFDHVLGAVGDLQVAVAVDGADVAGVEEAFLVDHVAVALVIGSRDRGPAHHEAAEGLAVPGQALAGVVGDLHLDAERRMALLHLDVEPRLAGELGIFRLERAGGAERAHLGHAPGVVDLDAVDLLERLGHGARAGRAADHHALEVRQLAAGRFEMLQQREPDGGHRRGAGDLELGEQLVDRRSVELLPGEYHRGAGHRRGEAERPAVGVKQRHHRQRDVGRRHPHHVGPQRRHRVQHVGAVRIERRPWDCRWCRRCSTCRPRSFRRAASRRNRRRPRRSIPRRARRCAASSSAYARRRTAGRSVRWSASCRRFSPASATNVTSMIIMRSSA